MSIRILALSLLAGLRHFFSRKKATVSAASTEAAEAAEDETDAKEMEAYIRDEDEGDGEEDKRSAIIANGVDGKYIYFFKKTLLSPHKVHIIEHICLKRISCTFYDRQIRSRSRVPDPDRCG